jgi:hypothetical protein
MVEARKALRAKHAKPRLRLYRAWLVKTRAAVRANPLLSGTRLKLRRAFSIKFLLWNFCAV